MNRTVLLATLCATLVCAASTANAVVATDSTATGAADATSDASAGSSRIPVPPPQETPELKRILKAMREASTQDHPDLFGEFAGMRRLFKGKYAGALKYFKFGARFADKLSQYGIGMMYINGRGVEKDPATGCAWLALASERKYPKFVQAHDVLCSTLTPEQHKQASAVLDKLLPVYGDAVAKRRMVAALREAKFSMTGSRTGFDFGITSAAPPNSQHECNAAALCIGGVAVPWSHGRYNSALLDPKVYFAARDAQFKATITIGAVQDVTARDSHGSADQKDHKGDDAKGDAGH